LLSPSGIKGRLFYGWIVVAAFCILGIMTNGLSTSFGVFFKSIESEFGLTRAVTSSIFSVYMLLGCIFAIFGGWVLDRYGPRIIILLMGIFTGLSMLLTSQTNAPWQIFITYSLLFSPAAGGIYIVMTATASRWFDKKRGLALGIATAGMGLGTLILAPFTSYLISNFSWRMAYLILGLIAWLVVIPLSRLLKKDPYEIGALPDGARAGETEIEKPGREDKTQHAGLSLLQASKTKNFWLFGAIWLLYAFCYFLVLTHIVRHAIDIGVSPMEAAGILSLIGGSSIAGRLLMGWASDKIGIKPTVIFCAILIAGTMLWLIWIQDLWMLYLFGIVCGFSFGGLDPPVTAVIGDTFGLRSIGVILGTLNVAWGIGGALGPAVGGLIFDVSKSYSFAFLTGALAMLTLALLMSLVKRATSWNIWPN